FNLNFDEIKEMLIRSNLDDLLKSTGVLMSLHQYPTSTAAFTIYIKSFLSFWSSRKMPLVVAMPPSITSTVTWPRSEERRVGQECRDRGSRYRAKDNRY